MGEIELIRSQYPRLWPKFLESLSVSGLRGWTGQSVEFTFPVTAIVGENGTGKSTLLRAAACAYETESKPQFYPSAFFQNTHWDTVTNVDLSYRIRQGNDVSTYRIKKPTSRWSFVDKLPRRHVFFLDISRTLPLDASAGYAKIAKQAVAEASSEDIADPYRDKLSYIMGRDYSQARFAITQENAKRPVGLLTVVGGNEISQFHHGAGEDTMLDTMQFIQNLPDTALVLIDEVEASLHPKAQRRLMRFLVELCRQKRLQIIVTTHSPYVLEEVPIDARILIQRGNESLNVIRGVTPEYAMSSIDDIAYPELDIYVEDRSAAAMLREILSSGPQTASLLQRIRIVPAGSADVVRTLGSLSASNKLPNPGMALLDGDQHDNPGDCGCLPGTVAPERLVFEELRAANWPNLSERFGIGAGTLYDYLEDAMRDNDHHTWCSLVGDRVHRSASGVWDILVHEWARNALSEDDRNRIGEAIQARLPKTAEAT